MRVVETASLDVGLGHVVPHRRREAVPQVGVLLAPEAGPGHAAEQHHQQERRAPETDHHMQVTPEQPSASAPAWPQHSGRRLPAWPPQVQPRHHQHHAPTGGHFHQAVADRADQQLAVNRPGHGLQVVFRILLAQYIAMVWVDEYVQFPTLVDHHELRAALGIDRRQVLLDLAFRVGLADLFEQVVRRQAVVPGGYVQQAAIHQWIELWLEQVNDAGQRQHHHEWRDEQPGIKMPAPGQVVEIRFRLAH